MTYFPRVLCAVAVIAVGVVTIMTTVTDTADVISRDRRSLIFQSGAVMQLTFGVTSPVDIPNKTVALSVCLQANFFLPTNATELDYFYYVRQTRRDVGDISLGAVYKRLEAALQGQGFHGEHCMLRSICEAAASPLDRDRGLLEELLHLILTPSEDTGVVDELYLAAEQRGRRRGDCDTAFPACAASPLEMFTTNMLT